MKLSSSQSGFSKAVETRLGAKSVERGLGPRRLFVCPVVEIKYMELSSKVHRSDEELVCKSWQNGK